MKLGELRRGSFGAWSRSATVDGITYHVSVSRGNRVVIPFKPRGENIGFVWLGYVRDAAGSQLWAGRVNKSNGVRGILRYAGIL